MKPDMMTNMIKRIAENTIHRYAKGFPVVSVTGPRQSGKTVLAKMAFPKKKYLSLEDPDTILLARSDPRGFLETWPDGMILDEAQYVPELFPYIKTIVDRDPKPGKYIITGSQQFNLMSKITESLAGRTAFLTLLPFSFAELAGTGAQEPFDLMLKGFYPPIYDRDISAEDFYSAYIASYVERDLRQIINVKDLGIFRNFLKFCAARTGAVLNLNSLSSDCGLSHNTVRAWISALEISGIIFLLQPYYKNFGKRLIKSPRLYFIDSGLVCRLLGINTREQLFTNPMRGSLFEGFIISELLKNRLNKGKTPGLWYWRENSGTEIDCIFEENGKLHAMEIKSGKTFNDDMIKGLNGWRKLNTEKKDDLTMGDLILINAGTIKSTVNGIKILPWDEVRYF